jgi:hypothetical protein
MIKCRAVKKTWHQKIPVSSHPMHDRADLPELLEAFKKKDSLIKEFEAAKQNLKKAKYQCFKPFFVFVTEKLRRALECLSLANLSSVL